MANYLILKINWDTIVTSKINKTWFYVDVLLKPIGCAISVPVTLLVHGKPESTDVDVGSHIDVKEHISGCFELISVLASNVRYVNDDMFGTQYKDYTKIIPVNLVGVAGRGLALYWKKKHPEHFEQYQHLCKCGELNNLNPVRMDEYILVPTKGYWGNPSTIFQLRESLIGLRYLMLREAGKHQYILPLLGCGKETGGLNPDVVEPIINTILNPLPTEIVISRWEP